MSSFSFCILKLFLLAQKKMGSCPEAGPTPREKIHPCRETGGPVGDSWPFCEHLLCPRDPVWKPAIRARTANVRFIPHRQFCLPKMTHLEWSFIPEAHPSNLGGGTRALSETGRWLLTGGHVVRVAVQLFESSFSLPSFFLFLGAFRLFFIASVIFSCFLLVAFYLCVDFSFCFLVMFLISSSISLNICSLFLVSLC